MIGLGTIVNTAAIVVGGLLGMLLKKALSKRVQDGIMKANGICVLFIGIAGAMTGMLKIIDNGTLETANSMMVILSVVLGTVVGEIINIEKGFEKFGNWLKKKTKSENDTSFLNGFLTASFTVCIGAMAIVGSINDGLFADHSLLFAKAILDFIIIMIMAASMGKGCIFSAIPVLIIQGLVTALARFIKPIMTEQAILNISLTGSILIFCVGLNLVWDKKIRVANMLPTLIFAVGFAFIPWF